MKTTTQVHANDNEMTFRASRLFEGIDDRPGYGHDTVTIKIGVGDFYWDLTIFVDGDDATLFRLHTQLHDLAEQVEELISPDAMIVSQVDRVDDEEDDHGGM